MPVKLVGSGLFLEQSPSEAPEQEHLQSSDAYQDHKHQQG